MKARHALVSRNAFCWLIAFAALGVVQVVQASTYPIERQARIWEAYQGVFDRPNSVVLDIKYPRTGSTLPSSTPAGTSPLGNMGVAQAGTGVQVSGNVAAPLSGTAKTAPVVARAAIGRAAFIRGVGLAAANPLVGIGLAIAAPSLADWLLLGNTKINPSATSPDDAFLRKEDYFNENGEYEIIEGIRGEHKGWTRSLSSAIGSRIGDKNAYWATLGNPLYPLTMGACDIAASRCYVHLQMAAVNMRLLVIGLRLFRVQSGCPHQWMMSRLISTLLRLLFLRLMWLLRVLPKQASTPLALPNLSSLFLALPVFQVRQRRLVRRQKLYPVQRLRSDPGILARPSQLLAPPPRRPRITLLTTTTGLPTTRPITPRPL